MSLAAGANWYRPIIGESTVRLLLLLVLLGCHVNARADAAGEVSAVLSRFHAAAAASDFDTYFSLFAEDGWFLGTDASERWSVTSFQAYARPAFAAGKGWRYDMESRHVTVSSDGKLAWFDEVLRNAGLGRCRGSGVVVQVDGQWRIALYSLSMLIPNDIAYDVGKLSMAADSGDVTR